MDKRRQAAYAAQAKAMYEAPLVSTDNSHQKFPIGARVFISKNLPRSMGHFQSGVKATVKYTYSQKYNMGCDNYNSYALDIDGYGSSAWYYENNLTLLKES